MMNNYCLRRLRYALDLNDKDVLDTFALASYKLTPSELKSYLVKEEDKGYVELPDYILVIFLDGLIIKMRGAREGETPLTQVERVEQSKKVKLNNNMVLNKIKIAFTLNSDDLIKMLELADFRVSKGEMSAFFRKPDHRNYRECGNQLIRNLLTGITVHLHKGKKGAVKVKPVKSKPGSKDKSNSQASLKAKSKFESSGKSRVGSGVKGKSGKVSFYKKPNE
jgi:uncharacterized protein YehS (DUF1456 family)